MSSEPDSLPPSDPTSLPSAGRHLKYIVATGVCLLVLGLTLAIWPGRHTEQRFVVLPGASAHTVARDLRGQRLIGSKWVFLGWVKLHGAQAALRPGVYWIPPGWTGFSIYQKLRRGPPLIRVTFPEGWTSRQMAALLEDQGVTTAAEFLNIVSKEQREGFLFPDTYFFGQRLPPRQVIDRMVRRFHEMEPKDMIARAKALHVSYRQIVILASLVEREARVPQERAVIAGVFYNRLRKRWRLESCATVEYALGKWKPHLTYKDLAIDSPYNTYTHTGLPPGPICNPGKAALEAAAHPAVTEMMFFVVDGKGTHRFTKYYQEHLAAQKHPKK